MRISCSLDPLQYVGDAGFHWSHTSRSLDPLQYVGDAGFHCQSLSVRDTVVPYLSAVMSHLWRDFSLVMRHDIRWFLLEGGDFEDFWPSSRAQVNSKHVPKSHRYVVLLIVWTWCPESLITGGVP